MKNAVNYAVLYVSITKRLLTPFKTLFRTCNKTPLEAKIWCTVVYAVEYVHLKNLKTHIYLHITLHVSPRAAILGLGLPSENAVNYVFTKPSTFLSLRLHGKMPSHSHLCSRLTRLLPTFVCRLHKTVNVCVFGSQRKNAVAFTSMFTSHAALTNIRVVSSQNCQHSRLRISTEKCRHILRSRLTRPSILHVDVHLFVYIHVYVHVFNFSRLYAVVLVVNAPTTNRNASIQRIQQNTVLVLGLA